MEVCLLFLLWKMAPNQWQKVFQMEGKCSDSHAGGSNLLSSTCFSVNLPWKIHNTLKQGWIRCWSWLAYKTACESKLALEYMDRVGQTAEPVSNCSLFKFISVNLIQDSVHLSFVERLKHHLLLITHFSTLWILNVPSILKWKKLPVSCDLCR